MATSRVRDSTRSLAPMYPAVAEDEDEEEDRPE